MCEVGDVREAELPLHRAMRGDQRAWRELVDRNSAVVWGTARAYSTNGADAEDVYQVTWLLLAENLNQVREPAALPGWLVTTARREAIRLAKARQREAPIGLDSPAFVLAQHAESPESTVLRSMLGARMWQAFAQLSHRCQQLLRVVAVTPDASYAQVSAALGIARGTIGPKKSRCLATLRQHMAATGLPEEAAG